LRTRSLQKVERLTLSFLEIQIHIEEIMRNIIFYKGREMKMKIRISKPLSEHSNGGGET
jgi:hypothetical protein